MGGCRLALAACATFLILSLLPAVFARAIDCQLGSYVLAGESRAFDTNGDGEFDWPVSDLN
jgi:hypothetical protein